MEGNFFDCYFLGRKVYQRTLTPVEEEYGLTRMELTILLFLTNNPGSDTAADIVQKRGLTKSHVSAAVDSLVRRGYLERTYLPGNRKAAHLHPLPPSRPAVEAGRAAQREFVDLLTRGLDMEALHAAFRQMADNLRAEK